MRWPNAGFPHPHADMEIITYVRAGYRRTRIVSTTKAEPKPEMRKARAHYRTLRHHRLGRAV
jgi:redox-sensitive bicupin YhaK (pirin superfamily)